MEIIDQLHRKIHIDKIPERIVSLVPSQTELLVDLGLEDRIVGVTKFCVHPRNLRKKKTVVGGTKTLDLAKIKALNPDIILCNKEENTKEIIYGLWDAFPMHISDIQTMQDAYELIEHYGKLFAVAEKAASLNAGIKREVRDFQRFISGESQLKVAYFVWRNPWMVVGGDTFVNHLLEMNHFENVYQSIPLYPKVELDTLCKADLILLSSEPFPFKERHRNELLPYAENARFAFVDGEYFSWYGSRLEKAFRYFRKLHEVGF